MDEDGSPEVVVRLRLELALRWAVAATVLAAALLVAALLTGELVPAVLYPPLITITAWQAYRTVRRTPERLRIGPGGLTVGQARPIPWDEIADVRWRPPAALWRRLGHHGRLRVLTESQRRFTERYGGRSDTLPIGTHGLELGPEQLLELIAQHAPRLARTQTQDAAG